MSGTLQGTSRGSGYVEKTNGTHVKPWYEKQMFALWEKSSVMWFYDWDPPQDGNGPHWYRYYRKQIARDLRTGRLTQTEARQLEEYLDIVGT